MKYIDDDKPVLDYKPGSRGPGCGVLIMQTMAGMAAVAFCAILARTIAQGMSEPGQFATLAIVFGTVLAGFIWLAIRNQPGFVVGFLITGSVLGLLIGVCGVRVLFR